MNRDREALLSRARRISSNLGFACAARFVYHRLTAWAPRRRTFLLWPRAAACALEIRPRTSDLDVFAQVFSGDEYGPLVRGRRADVILDGGANVGYSAAYFLTRFPQARVIAIEPDRENFELLSRNLRPYGARAQVIFGALWSHRTELALSSGFRDGRAWSRQVRDSSDVGDDRVPAFSVADVLQRTGVTRVSILKLDVEGAEAEIFSRGTESWIELVDAFVVELHEDTPFGSASAALRGALDRFGTRYSTSGELTIAEPIQRSMLGAGAAHG